MTTSQIKIYTNWCFKQMEGEQQILGNSGNFDMSNSTLFKVMLLKSSYTPDLNHILVSDIDTHEVAAGSSYSLGGLGANNETLGLSIDASGRYDANFVFGGGSTPPSSGPLTIQQDPTGFTDARYWVLYKKTVEIPNSANDRLIAYGDWLTDQSIQNRDLEIVLRSELYEWNDYRAFMRMPEHTLHDD